MSKLKSPREEVDEFIAGRKLPKWAYEELIASKRECEDAKRALEAFQNSVNVPAGRAHVRITSPVNSAIQLSLPASTKIEFVTDDGYEIHAHYRDRNVWVHSYGKPLGVQPHASNALALKPINDFRD